MVETITTGITVAVVGLALTWGCVGAFLFSIWFIKKYDI